MHRLHQYRQVVPLLAHNQPGQFFLLIKVSRPAVRAAPANPDRPAASLELRHLNQAIRAGNDAPGGDQLSDAPPAHPQLQGHIFKAEQG